MGEAVVTAWRTGKENGGNRRVIDEDLIEEILFPEQS
jgi:hypothetical protein